MPAKQHKFGGAQQITSWSFSRWTTWSQCPARAKYRFIEKRPEPQSSAGARGDLIGKMADKYVAGAMKTLPKTIISTNRNGEDIEEKNPLLNFKVEFNALRKAKAQTQMSIAFTKDWDACSPTDWDNAWVRMQLDVTVPPKSTETDGVLHVIDNKTGRINSEDYTPQLELYAVGGLLKYPQATTVRTNLYFLDHGVIIGADATPPYKPSGIYARKQLAMLRKKWEQRVEPMLNATNFPPMPGNHCRWCPFSKANKGPCKF